MPAKGSFVAFNADSFSARKIAKRSAEAVKARIADTLAYIGEYCVKVARESGSYNDITGNLRSSIGYVILQDGQPIRKGQSQQYSGSKGDGKAGAEAAQSLLEKLQAEFPKGIVLIVCAGMKYASYVENIHHKDVLTSAELKAKSLARQLLAALTN